MRVNTVYESHILQTCHGRKAPQAMHVIMDQRISLCFAAHVLSSSVLVCLSVNWSSAEHLLCLKWILFGPLFWVQSPNSEYDTGKDPSSQFLKHLPASAAVASSRRWRINYPGNDHSVCPYKPLMPLKVQLGTFVGVIKCLADTDADQRIKSPHTNFTDAEST